MLKLFNCKIYHGYLFIDTMVLRMKSILKPFLQTESPVRFFSTLELER